MGVFSYLCKFIFEHKNMYTVIAELNKIRFHANDSGYTVANFKLVNIEDVDPNTPKPEWIDFADCFNAVFYMPEPKPAMRLRLEGEPKVSKYGLQLNCTRVTEILPTTAFGIEQFLGSGIISNIGPVIAKRIVDIFGEKTLEVLDSASDELYNVKGVSKTRMKSIINEWGRYKSVREIYIYLEGLGISPALVTKIYKKYEENTITTIKSNPYCIIEDISGIGFATADSIAIKMGYQLDGPERIQAAIIHVLESAGDDGHCFLPQIRLTNQVSQMIHIHPDKVSEQYASLIESKRIIEDHDNVYCRRFFFAEMNVAKKMVSMLNNKNNSILPCLTDNDFEKLEQKMGITYAEQQKKAIQTAIQSKVMLLTGGPGTGKTTVLKAIIDIFKKERLEIIACAPTGKAAERMCEATGIEAMTIHRTLGFLADGTFQYSSLNPLDGDVVIVDESSMIEITLMSHLLDALTDRHRFILVGDIDQLPCIGPGNILRDIINSNIIPVVALDTIFRQAEGSFIISNAHRINNGLPPIMNAENDKDFFFIPETNPLRITDTIVGLIKERLPRAYGYKPEDIQVLSPMKKGDAGTEVLNFAIQTSINNNLESIKKKNIEFKKGDRVVQTVNNYNKGVFNGDTGIILGFSTGENNEKEANIKFKGGRIVKYDSSEFNELILGYALTIHKSQGSEFPVVIMPITSQHHIMLQRNLIYTGVTRAKKLCILIGSKAEIAYAAQNFVVTQRYTALTDRLIQQQEKSNSQTEM